MTDPSDLAAFLASAWQHLSRGVADRRAPARYPTFATIGPDGTPQSRTVALRGASPSAGTLEVHTDIVTDKVTALRHNARAALHVWIPRSDLQIRVTAQVEILTGEAVQSQWDQIPAGSRVSYGTLPDPGTPIDHVYAFEKPAERSRFAVLACTVTALDLVHLGEQHRRAGYTREDGFAGKWLAP